MTNIQVSGYLAGEEYCLEYEDNGDGIIEFVKEIVSRHELRRILVRDFFCKFLDMNGIWIRECGIYGKGVRFEMVNPEGRYQVQIFSW